MAQNPSSISVLSKLEKYKDDSSYFVTFTNLEKVGINPKNAFSTPIGVYAYNLKDLWKDWEAGDDFFGKDRPYVNLLKLKTNDVLDIENYVLDDKDLNLLKSRYRGTIAFEDLFKLLKQDKHSIYHSKNDGDILWKLSEAVAISQSLVGGISTGENGIGTEKSFTIKWNKLLRDMGYKVVLDKQSTIHLLQSSQAVFLTPASYDLVGRYYYKEADKKRVAQKSPDLKEHFWHPGPNPTVDVVVIKDNHLLLIKRGEKSGVEAGKWALPGGFMDTKAHKGEPWVEGRETPKKAALRELKEETNLYISNIKDVSQRLVSVGVFEGKGRDPRDSERAWSKSHAFAIKLKSSDNLDMGKIEGRDDAIDAKWFPLDSLPETAFDHREIIFKALVQIGKKDRAINNLEI
jgi:8-oxo-dGTP diphosphatase